MSTKVSANSIEDLEDDKIQLVHLKDILPQANNTVLCTITSPRIGNSDNSDKNVETIEFEIDDNNECSLGSMVFIDAEDIKCEESNEVVIQECSNDTSDSSDVKPDITSLNTHPKGWPTLEILPGGIIKNADNVESNMHLCDDIVFDNSELLFACAKCPMKFKNMFYLVKHIKWHEIQKKIQSVVQNDSSLKAETKTKLKKRMTKKSKKS